MIKKDSLHSFKKNHKNKVIIEKPCGEVSLMGQDTIENVSYTFDTSKWATNYRVIFKVYAGFIGEKILKLWRQESRPYGPNPAQISILVPQKSPTVGLLYNDFSDDEALIKLKEKEWGGIRQAKILQWVRNECTFQIIFRFLPGT